MKGDHSIALTLKSGAYLSVGLLVTGLVLALFELPFGMRLMNAGVLVLLATPLLRIIVAGVGFARERDWHYVGVAAGVLAVVLLALAIGATR